MGLFKKIKKGVKKVAKVAGKVAPVAAAFIPGVGPLAAAGIGAGLGALGGGGIKGALQGGLMTGLGSGLGNLARGGQFMGAGGGLGSIFGSGVVDPKEAFRMSELGQSPSGGGIDWGSAFNSFLGGPAAGTPGINPRQMGGMEALFGGLGGLYQGYKQGQSLDNQRQTLDDLYSFDSPYAQQMRSTLERKDAAAGRRSQYGTREVELMGDLAGKRAAAANSMFNIGQAQDTNRFNTLSNSMNYGMASGALQGAGRGLQNLYNQYQNTY